MITNVSVKVSDLKAKLIVNRTAHEKTYNEAVIGYIEGMKDYYKELNKRIQKCSTTSQINECWNGITKPTEPNSYVSDYDHALAMLEFETRDTLELESSTFKQLVLDQWSWKNSFVATSNSNISYLASKSGH